MQSFCHTAAYPKPVDIKIHPQLPAPSSAIPWRRGPRVRRRRDPQLVELPAAAGYRRHPAATATPASHWDFLPAGFRPGCLRRRHWRVMPLDMPGIRCWCFKGECSPASPLRDQECHSAVAIRAGLLTVEKKGKKTSSTAASWKSKACRPQVEQAERPTPSPERSAAACTVQ